MFWASDVSEKPQTQESGRSFGATQRASTPVLRIRSARPGPAVGELDLTGPEEVDDVGVGAPQGAELIAVVDQMLGDLVELLRRQVHRVLDAERERGLGDCRQRVVGLERRLTGIRGVEEVREGVDLTRGDRVGVVDQALRARRERNDEDVGPVADPGGIAEDEVVPRR